MKKTLFFILSVFILASCEDKESWMKKNPIDPVYDEYSIAFRNEYGNIDSTQSWDFYSQMLNGTRAYSNITFSSVSQPTDVDFDYWQSMLQSGKNNTNVGTHQYTLISNGSFFAYPVWYAGWYEVYAKYKFEMGIYYNGKYTKIFDGLNNTDNEQSLGFAKNPGYGAEINIPKGDKFAFYIRYTVNNKRITRISNQNDCSSLLYTNNNDIMVIGFEDDSNNNADNDYNDIILYLKGNTELPIVESKRFMCEDLGTIGDFDFNDVVFDVQPVSTGKVKVTLQACGGTLPIDLYVNNTLIGEVHELLGVSTSEIVNTGIKTMPVYSTVINVPSDFDISDFTNIKLCVHDNDESTRYITFSDIGKAPCVLATPINTKWVKERTNIKLGYPNFFNTEWFNTFDVNYLYY